MFCHVALPFFFHKNSARQNRAPSPPHLPADPPQDLAPCAGSLRWLPGFIGPVPSAALDKEHHLIVVLL